MSVFRRRVLPVLDRVYGFLSARTATDQLDLNAPIQLVHDVSREAELYPLGPGFGFLFYGYTLAAGGTDRISVDLYNAAESISSYEIGEVIRREEINIWLFDVQAYAEDPADVTTLNGSLNYPASNGGVPFHSFELVKPLWISDGSTADPSNDDFANIAGSGDLHVLLNELDPVQWPIPIMDGGEVCWLSVGLSQDVFLTHLFWMGKKGVMPPGMR